MHGEIQDEHITDPRIDSLSIFAITNSESEVSQCSIGGVLKLTPEMVISRGGGRGC